MSVPIIIVCGPAGSGKDTAAAIIARNHNGVCIALADPMKRFAAQVFGFNEEQLWGPSELRNAEDQRFATIEGWSDAHNRLRTFGPLWLDGIGLSRDVYPSLATWFNNVCEMHIDGTPANEARLGPWWHHGNIWRVLTPRYVLQTLGTEWGRAISKDLWIDVGMRTAVALLAGGPRYTRADGLSDDVGYHGPDYVLITDGRFRNEVLKVQASGGYALRIEPVAPANDAASTEAAGVAGHVSEKELGGIPRHFFTHILANDKSAGLAILDVKLFHFVHGLKRRTAEVL